jgi:LysR family transcriptional regulator, hydrogen peroxide-inducible genes activator
LTLSELRFVVALARERNFRRAAEKCFVSQPALSLAIKKLEEELGLSLFERSRSSVTVTSIGQLIINQANVVLDEAEKIKELSQQGDGQLGYPFSLGLIYSIAPYLLPLIIPILRRDLPKMPLEVEENITKNLEEHLKKGSLDAAIIALPFEKPGIECVHLYDELFEVIVPINHALADKISLSAKELGREKVMLLDNDHCYSNQILEACPGLAKNRDVQLGNSLETIRNMVASNLGISVLPKSATVSGYENPLVKTIPFSDPKPYRRVALAYRKSTVKKEAINHIIQSIQKINLNSILN